MNPILCIGQDSLKDNRLVWAVPELASEHVEMAVDKKGHIWVGTLKGLFRFNGCEWHRVDIKLPTQFIHALNFDQAGNLWVGFYKSGFLVLKMDGTIQLPKGDDELINPYQNCGVYGFLEIENYMYLASELGILKVSKDLHVEAAYKFKDQFPDLLYGPHSMNMVRIIKQNPLNNKEFLVGGTMGFCIFNIENKKYIHYPMPKHFLTGLKPLNNYIKNRSYFILDLEVSSQNVMTATWGGGICIFNLISKKWEQYIYQTYDDSKPLDENVSLKIKKINDSIAVAAALRVSAPVLFNFKTKQFLSFPDYFNTTYVKEPASSVHVFNDKLLVANFSGIALYDIPSKSETDYTCVDICKITSDKDIIFYNNGFTNLPDTLVLKQTESQLKIDFFTPFSSFPTTAEIHYYLNGKNIKSTSPYTVLLDNIPSGFSYFSFTCLMDDVSYSGKSLIILNSNNKHKNLKLILSGIIFLLLLAGLYYWNNKRTFLRRRFGQTEVIRRIDRLEMESLQSRMNPHFLFNSLNSIKSYIINNEKRLATDFINDFAKLLREILYYSQSLYISLEKELDIIATYVKLEQNRFKEPFDYILSTENNIELPAVYVPSLLLQPFVENAIWHGMSHRTRACKLEIDISRRKEIIEILIKDDGIGRRLSIEKKNPVTKQRRSTGIELAKARLRHMYGETANIKITDLPNDSGTEVIIQFNIKLFNMNYLNTESE
ncbi:MAG: histidine kinase [Saprospiraceae bacterium]